jgi:D-alanyl-D-alanine-carboxypeptidase/D-alanyl-D-alanine-endopeptidase
MAKYIQYNLKMNPTMWEVPTTAEAVYRQRQTLKTALGFDESGPMWGRGLASVTMAAEGARPMIVQKAGGGGGFMTYIALAPGRNVGVFVAVNRVDFRMYHGMAAAVNDLIANLVTR